MYFQRKKLCIKVCRIRIARCSEGYPPLVIKREIVGTHLTQAQADKYVRKTFGAGYALLSFSNDIQCVNLDIEKIYKESKKDE